MASISRDETEHFEYDCSYCGEHISFAKYDYHAKLDIAGVYVCPCCGLPAFFFEGKLHDADLEIKIMGDLCSQVGLSKDEWMKRERHAYAKRDCVPISTDDILDHVLQGESIEFRRIEDLGNVLKRISTEAPEKILNLQWCHIDKCYFVWSDVDNPLRIQSCTFSGEARFWEVDFKQWVNFSNTSFQDDVLFSNSTFFDLAIFEYVRFAKSANFGSAKFCRNASFHGACFLGDMRFQNTEVEKTLSLNDSDFWASSVRTLHFDRLPSGQITLSMEQIGRYQRPICSSKWPGRHGRMRRWIYRRILKCRKKVRAYWPSVYMISSEQSTQSTDLRFAAAQYNILANNFGSIPNRERQKEDRCRYKYKDLTRKAKEAQLNSQNMGRTFRIVYRVMYFLEWFIMKWCLGYMIYTKRILLTALGTIAMFGLLYACVADPTTIEDYDVDFSGLYFSCVTFTTIGYGDYSPKGWLRFVAGIEGFSGLVLAAILTVSFARKLID